MTPQSLPGVYLIDTSIYIFRGWFVWPDTLTNHDGNPVNAVHGFADFLLQLIETRQPSHIVCAFDSSLETSARKKIYPDYKANRPPAPDELKVQFALCRQLVSALGILALSSTEFEADDILGTLAVCAQKQQQPFVVVTADKDLTQLLGKNDYWWSFAKDYCLDYRGVERRFGVRPHQIADLLALSGDKVDNIPGVPGVGMTTAARLLGKWGNIDTLRDNIEKVGAMKFRGAQRIQTLLENHWDKVEIARQLTPILHVPELPDTISQLQPEKPDLDALENLLADLSIDRYRIERWKKVAKTFGTRAPITVHQ